MDDSEIKKISAFLFELGTMKKIPRMHQQMLLSQDLSDNIATHSYRVAIISWFLAKLENLDPYKAILMALFHDVREIRSGDHNYVHKKYVKVFEEDILNDQVGNLPFKELLNVITEYDSRESKVSLIAKDADLLDQIILLKEYAHQGNKEAEIWLSGKGNLHEENIQLHNLKTESGKKLGKQLIEGNVSEWWENFWTNENK